jgi:hypothetical protein
MLRCYFVFSLVLGRIYQETFTAADPRTNGWFLIKSPMPGLTILATYLYFVLSWGPHYMKHRKPYKLTNLLILYNMAQVFVSIFLFYEVSSRCCATQFCPPTVQVKISVTCWEILEPSLGRSIDLKFLVDSFFCQMNTGLTPCNRDHIEKSQQTLR